MKHGTCDGGSRWQPAQSAGQGRYKHEQHIECCTSPSYSPSSRLLPSQIPLEVSDLLNILVNGHSFSQPHFFFLPNKENERSVFRPSVLMRAFSMALSSSARSASGAVLVQEYLLLQCFSISRQLLRSCSRSLHVLQVDTLLDI